MIGGLEVFPDPSQHISIEKDAPIRRTLISSVVRIAGQLVVPGCGPDEYNEAVIRREVSGNWQNPSQALSDIAFLGGLAVKARSEAVE